VSPPNVFRRTKAALDFRLRQATMTSALRYRVFEKTGKTRAAAAIALLRGRTGMALWFMRCVRGLLRGRSIVEIAADAGRARTSMNDRRHNALRMLASERALHHEGAIV